MNARKGGERVLHCSIDILCTKTVGAPPDRMAALMLSCRATASGLGPYVTICGATLPQATDPMVP